jgi:hypothetical protein
MTRVVIAAVALVSWLVGTTGSGVSCAISVRLPMAPSRAGKARRLNAIAWIAVSIGPTSNVRCGVGRGWRRRRWRSRRRETRP